MDINISKALLWSLLAAAVGGGIYGSYIKTFGKAAHGQVSANTLSGQCASLLSSSDPDSIDEFIVRANKAIPEIQKSDAVTGLVAMVAAADHQQKPTSGDPLRVCLGILQGRLDELRPPGEMGRL